MIYTVTFNPCLDYVVYVPDYKAGIINKSKSEQLFVGGKGINVSLVLKNLGIPSKVLGFVAGPTGGIIRNEISSYGLEAELIKAPVGFSRINVKLKSSIETDINGSGPVIDSECMKSFYKSIDKIKDDDILILSGSVCRGTDSAVYSDIMKYLSSHNVRVVVDATSDLLYNTLQYKPFLIKPNNFELGELFGKELTSEGEIIECALKLQESGAQNVLVSLGAEGAVLVCNDGRIIKQKAPDGNVINTTGAGDSMVAGFIAGYVMSEDVEYALKLGICTGSATAFSEHLAKKELIMELMGNLNCQG